MTKKREMRTFDITNFQTRDGTDSKSIKVSGYAAVFNSKATIGNWFEEVILPGAFSRALSENSDVRALFNHDWNYVLGRTKSRTLHLEEDDRGLKFEVELPNTTFARDLVESMERGDIDQCSFLFDATGESWDYSVEPALRTVSEVKLYEVSIVPLPSYEDTEAAVMRSKDIGKEVEKRMAIIKKINQTLEEK